MEPKSLCRIIAFVFILARTLDSRENPFIKLDSGLFSRFLALAPSLCVSVYTYQIKELTATGGIFSEQWNTTPSHLKLFERV